MNIEDVIKGTRVKVIADSVNVIPIGSTGTLIQSFDSAPYVSFDEYHEGCFKAYGHPNVRAMTADELEELNE